jgi:hypothetical protein
MDENQQKASHANLQIKRLERELDQTTDKDKRATLAKEIDKLRLSIS